MLPYRQKSAGFFTPPHFLFMGRGLHETMQPAIHMNKVAPFASSKADRDCTFSCAVPIRFFIFGSGQKSTVAFLQHAGEMNTGKKHFRPTHGNGVADTREVSKGGPGGLPLAHDLARKV